MRTTKNDSYLYSAVIYSNDNEIAYCDIDDWSIVEKFVVDKLRKNSIVVEITNTQSNKLLSFDYDDYIKNNKELPISPDDLEGSKKSYKQ